MLRDKVVVVTGGAGRLGRAFVRAVATSGGTAIVADIDEKAARAVAEDLEGSSGKAIAAAVDVTSESSIDALIEKVYGQHDRLDAVVNNAYPRNPNYGRDLEEVT